MRAIISDQVKIAYRYPARAVGAAGAALMLVSIFLPWSYGGIALDDMSYYGSPSPLQFCFGALALTVLALLTIPLVGKQRLGKWAKVLAWNTTAKTASITALITSVIAVASIAIE